MKTSLTVLALMLCACGSAQQMGAPAKNPVCVTGGLVPADESMVDYGTTYTPNLEGPAPAVPVARAAKCVDTHRGHGPV